MITLRWLLKQCSNEPLEKSLICWLYLPTYLCFDYQLSTILINTGWPSCSWINFRLKDSIRKDEIKFTLHGILHTHCVTYSDLLWRWPYRVRGHSVIYRARFIPPQKVVQFCKDAIFSRIWQKKKQTRTTKMGEKCIRIQKDVNLVDCTMKGQESLDQSFSSSWDPWLPSCSWDL